MTNTPTGNKLGGMVEKDDWILNLGGESPYDMIRRGREVPEVVVKEADNLRRQLRISLGHEVGEKGLKPLFPELPLQETSLDSWLK